MSQPQEHNEIFNIVAIDFGDQPQLIKMIENGKVEYDSYSFFHTYLWMLAEYGNDEHRTLIIDLCDKTDLIKDIVSKESLSKHSIFPTDNKNIQDAIGRNIVFSNYTTPAFVKAVFDYSSEELIDSPGYINALTEYVRKFSEVVKNKNCHLDYLYHVLLKIKPENLYRILKNIGPSEAFDQMRTTRPSFDYEEPRYRRKVLDSIEEELIKILQRLPTEQQIELVNDIKAYRKIFREFKETLLDAKPKSGIPHLN